MEKVSGRMEPACENEAHTLQPWTASGKAIMLKAIVHSCKIETDPLWAAAWGEGRQGSAAVLTGAKSLSKGRGPGSEGKVEREAGAQKGSAGGGRQLAPALSLSPCLLNEKHFEVLVGVSQPLAK